MKLPGLLRRVGVLVSSLVAVVALCGAPPSVTMPPISVTAVSGTDATFSVVAAGSAPLSYQWRRFGMPIVGATNPSLTLPSVRMADAGFYDVVVTNGDGATTSSAGRLFVEPPAYSSTWRIDPGFAPRLEGAGGIVLTMVETADGGCLVGGMFTTIAGQRRDFLTKFNASFALDSTFAPRFDGDVDAIAIQSDGKIVVGGGFGSIDGRPRSRIARLNADGSLDESFAPGAGFDEAVLTVAVQADGRIVAGGNFASFDGTPRSFVARLEANGAIDPTFDSAVGHTPGVDLQVRQLVLQSDGRILVGGMFGNVGGASRNNVARLMSDGSLDASFAPGTGANAAVDAVALQPDGRALLGGSFTAFNGAPAGRIVRLLASGAVDPTFSPGSGFDGYVAEIAVLADARIAVAGTFTSVNGVLRPGVAVLGVSGACDLTFAPTESPSLSGSFAIVPRTAGGIWLGGQFLTVGAAATSGVAAYAEAGALAGYVGAGFRQEARLQFVRPSQDGRWLVGGDLSHVNGAPSSCLVRLLPDGSVDAGFKPQFTEGNGQSPGRVSGAAIDGAGRIVVVGRFDTVNGVSRRRVARLLADGSLDPSLVSAGSFDFQPVTVALDSSGRIVVGGSFWSYGGATLNGIARLNPDGSRDVSFVPGSGFNSFVGNLAIQSDGRMVADGSFTAFAGQPRYGLARLLTDGSLDNSLSAPATFVSGTAADGLTMLPDGRLLAAGIFKFPSGTKARQLLRFNPDGSLDANFAATTDFSYAVRRVLPQADGRMLAAGYFTSVNGQRCNGLVRLDEAGAVDPTFRAWDLSGFSAGADVLFTDDGRLLIAGARGGRGGTSYMAVVMLKPEAAPVPAISSEPQGQTIAFGATATLEVAATGDGPLRYQWYRGEKGDVSSPVTGAANASFTTAPLDTWARYWVRLTNDYGSADSATALVRVVGGMMTFADWVAQDDLLVAQRGPLAIPAGDGVTNVMKFALGVSPMDSAVTRLPKATVVTEVGKPDALALEFTFNPLAQHLRVALEVSTDLSGWTEVPAVLEVLATNPDGMQLVRLGEASPPAATKRFGRLVVELTP